MPNNPWSDYKIYRDEDHWLTGKPLVDGSGNVVRGGEDVGWLTGNRPTRGDVNWLSGNSGVVKEVPVDSRGRASRRGFNNFDNDEDRRNARFLDPMDVEYGYSWNADVSGVPAGGYGDYVKVLGANKDVSNKKPSGFGKDASGREHFKGITWGGIKDLFNNPTHHPKAEEYFRKAQGYDPARLVNESQSWDDYNRRRPFENTDFMAKHRLMMGMDGSDYPVANIVTKPFFVSKEEQEWLDSQSEKKDKGDQGGGRSGFPDLKLEKSNSDELIEYLRNNLNVKRDSVNLQPLMALSDTWFGGNLAGNYQDPHDEVLANSERDLKIMSAIDQTDKSDLDRRNNLAKALYNVERDKVGDKVQADRLKADDWYRKQKLEQDKQYNFLRQQLKAQELPKEVRAYYNWFNREGNDWKSPINKRIKSFVDAQSKGQKLSHEQTNELLLKTQEDIVDESRGYLLQNPGASPVEVFNYVANRYENALEGISKSDE